MRFSLAFAGVVLLGLWCAHQVAAQDFKLCSFTDPTTSKAYDLTPLAKLFTSKAATTDPDSNGFRYYISPCQPVRGNAMCTTSLLSAAVCQESDKNSYPLGAVPDGTVSPLSNGVEGFMVTFLAWKNRGSSVSYICDPKAGQGAFKAVSILSPSGPEPFLWQFEWRTSYACPSGSGGGGGGGGGGASSDSAGLAGGWIFIIWHKFYFKREGLEIMPNSGFWLALPGLVKDGHVFLFNSARRMCGRGYQQI